MENNQQQLPSQQKTDQLNPISSANTSSYSPSKPFIILLVIILIATVGVGGYTLGIKHGKTIVQNQQTTTSPPIAQPSPTPIDETANWKTYRSEEFGFEVKYPREYQVRKGGVHGEAQFITKDPNSLYDFVVMSIIPKKSSVGVEEVLKNRLGLEELKEFKITDEQTKRGFDWLQKVTIGSDIPGYMIRRYDDAQEPIYEYHFGREGVRIEVGVDASFRGFIYNQILSTFKFLDKNQSPSPTLYIPLNPQIEEEGKLKVKNTPEVKTLIGKYGKSNVSIKALDIKLVKDVQFIMQLDPRFKEQTGCVIVVESNNSGYVYQLDKDNEILYRQTLEEFKQKTANVDQEILEKFYSSLS